jgi:hypothetical protein
MDFQVVYRARLDSNIVKLATRLKNDASLDAGQAQHLGYAVERGVFTSIALRTLRANLGSGGKSDADSLLAELIHGSSAKAEVVDVHTLSQDAASVAKRAARREAWRDEMRARAEHRAYSVLTASVRPDGATRHGGDDLPVDPATVTISGVSSYREQMSVGAGLLFTLLSAIALGYYAGVRLFGLSSPVPWVLALAAGIMALMVEGALLVIRLSKQDAAVALDGGLAPAPRVDTVRLKDKPSVPVLKESTGEREDPLDEMLADVSRANPTVRQRPGKGTSVAAATAGKGKGKGTGGLGGVSIDQLREAAAAVGVSTDKSR